MLEQLLDRASCGSRRCRRRILHRMPDSGHGGHRHQQGQISVTQTISPQDHGPVIAITSQQGKCQRACKPGSVHPHRGIGDHSSRGRIAPSLKQPTRAVSVETDLAVKLRAAPIRSCSRWGLPCRLALPQTRCALTAPFQFHWAEALVTCFLLHCPLDHSSRPLAGTVISWSPDFPRRGSYPPRRGRPALWHRRL